MIQKQQFTSIHSLLLIAILIVSGCRNSKPDENKSDETSSAQSSGLKVVVTTAMVGDLVEKTLGEHGTVEALIGEGVDPHLFRPTTSDIRKLMGADMIFYSGLMLEGSMEKAFEQVKKKGKTIAAVTESIPKDKLKYPAEFDGHPDPHAWNSVALWSSCLDTVVRVLSEQDPEHAADFKANAEAYREELTALNNYVHKVIRSIPEQQRQLVTAHDAFGYFAMEYDMNVKSVQGITTESDPGVQDINELVNFLVENKIGSVFVEATVNAANIRAVTEGAAQNDWEVKIGGTLYSDSMGAPGSYEGTYIGMMDYNATTIARALGGEAPVDGFQGKLTTATANSETIY